MRYYGKITDPKDLVTKEFTEETVSTIIPSQEGQSGKFLTTDGATTSWGIMDVPGKEDVANKVSSFQSTPDNTHYPSEKLVKDSLDAKQNKATLESDVAAKGFTKNTGTITGITMNGASKGTSGVVDLGTVITAHQDISGKQDKSALETDVAAKGFTKNTGTVTSVAAGTGLSVSGTATVNPTVNVASTHKLPTTSEWSGKADASALTSHTGDSTIHVTASDKSTWSGKQDALTAGNNITINSNTISALKYYKQSEVTGVAGTSTTKVSTTYDVIDTSVTSYYDGMMVTFVLPVAGVSTYGSVFQFNSLGYKPIVYNVNSVISTRYSVGAQITMIYNSVQTADAYLSEGSKSTITGCWQIMDYDTNTTYTPQKLGIGYGTCSTVEATVAKVVTLKDYTLVTNGIVSVKFTYAVCANATMNINSKGAKAIYYKGVAITAGIIKAGDIATFIYNGSQYNLIAIDTQIDPSSELVDLSSYAAEATLPDATVTKMKKYTTTVKYNNDYYRLVTDTVWGTTQMVLFAALNSSAGGSGLYAYKLEGSSEWKFSGRVVIEILGYNADGILNIKIENTDKCFRLSDNNEVTVIKKNTSQSGDINLTLPATTGILALTSDINNANIIAGLGYTPYNSTNPAGYITGITSGDVTGALGYIPYSAANPAGYITGITGQDVSVALGYTPYDANNPNRYISGITGADVTTALGYTPYDSTNPSNYISGISGQDVTTALGYVPYNNTNPNGYISGINSADVTTALGYTPYNATNPNNYVNQNVNNLTNYFTKTEVQGMVGNRFQALIVSALPTSEISTSTIYMVLQAGQTDIYDEWMYISNTWTKIGTTSIDMSEYAKIANLHNVATTGAYSSLVGKPDIPDDTSDLTNGAGFITKSVNNLDNYTATNDLAAVALTGAYSDLTGKPTAITNVSQLANDEHYIKQSDLATTNISSLYNDVPYATLSQIQGLEEIDVEEIKKAIAAMEHIGTVTQVTAGTGLTGGGNTSVTLNHANSVTAKSGYPTGTVLENGGSFTVRDAQYDAQGHITGTQDRTITMTAIPPYDDTTVRGLISDETDARELTDLRVTALENFNKSTFNAFVFCIFGIEPYIDPDTMQIVPNRYYQRSDVDTGIFMDNNKIDIHLKAWLQYNYGINTTDELKNITCYVYAMGDHGEYVNHMVTFWRQKNNPSITSYPHLQQVGSFSDDGYGSVRRFSTTEVGAILSSTDDGYIAADPTGTGKGYVSGWNTLTGRVTTLENTIGDINTVLDRINGEVI